MQKYLNGVSIPDDKGYGKIIINLPGFGFGWFGFLGVLLYFYCQRNAL